MRRPSIQLSCRVALLAWLALPGIVAADPEGPDGQAPAAPQTAKSPVVSGQPATAEVEDTQPPSLNEEIFEEISQSAPSSSRQEDREAAEREAEASAPQTPSAVPEKAPVDVPSAEFDRASTPTAAEPQEATATRPPEAEPAKEPTEQSDDAASSEEAEGRLRLVRVRWDRGIRIEGVKKRFRMKIGARLIADAVHISGTDDIADRFETGWKGGFRQARFDFTGTAGERFYYRAQIDVTGESSTDFSRNEYVKSAYLGVTKLGWLGRAEFGILKEPISMGVLTSGLNTDFMERGLATAFAPSFNVGLLFRNEILDESISWALGIFRGEGDDGNQDALDIAARLGTVVFRAEDGSHFFHIGGSYKFETGSFDVRYRARPETHWGDRWVDTRVIAADRSHVVGFEVAGVWQPLSFQAEVMASWVDRRDGNTVSFWGAYAQVSYFVTGEHRNYLQRSRVFGRVQLNNEFSWTRRKWGAVELALRYSYLDLDDRDVRGGRLGDLSFGVNWYILSHLRIQANYIHANLRGVGRGNLFSTRFQIDY